MKTEKKHTPGPWRAGQYKEGSSAWSITASPHRMWVCQINFGYGEPEDSEEVRANAQLIASSPAILEALEAQEEAEQAQDAYTKASLNPPCGLNAEETHNNWSIHLSDLAQDAFEMTAKAKELRKSALSAAKGAQP